MGRLELLQKKVWWILYLLTSHTVFTLPDPVFFQKSPVYIPRPQRTPAGGSSSSYSNTQPVGGVKGGEEPVGQASSIITASDNLAVAEASSLFFRNRRGGPGPPRKQRGGVGRPRPPHRHPQPIHALMPPPPKMAFVLKKGSLNKPKKYVYHHDDLDDDDNVPKNSHHKSKHRHLDYYQKMQNHHSHFDGLLSVEVLTNKSRPSSHHKDSSKNRHPSSSYETSSKRNKPYTESIEESSRNRRPSLKDLSREQVPDSTEVKSIEYKKQKDREREKEREREREREKEREREREREKDREREREREKEREREREAERKVERELERKRKRQRDRERYRSRERDRDHNYSYSRDEYYSSGGGSGGDSSSVEDKYRHPLPTPYSSPTRGSHHPPLHHAPSSYHDISKGPAPFPKPERPVRLSYYYDSNDKKDLKTLISSHHLKRRGKECDGLENFVYDLEVIAFLMGLVAGLIGLYTDVIPFFNDGVKINYSNNYGDGADFPHDYWNNNDAKIDAVVSRKARSIPTVNQTVATTMEESSTRTISIGTDEDNIREVVGVAGVFVEWTALLIGFVALFPSLVEKFFYSLDWWFGKRGLWKQYLYTYKCEIHPYPT